MQFPKLLFPLMEFFCAHFILIFLIRVKVQYLNKQKKNIASICAVH